MPKVYFYKLTVDDGGAPCVCDALLSLAICKPMIRNTAAEGDIVIGFAANSLHADNRLIYIARVTEKLSNGDYFRDERGQYRMRPDCIYVWKSGAFAVRDGAKYHGSIAALYHDLGRPTAYQRANTLLSKAFCYFGANGTAEYKDRFPKVAQAIALLGRGHRVHHDPALVAELDELVAAFCSLEHGCVNGGPSTGPRRGVSHRGGGCGVAMRRAKSC